MGNNASVSDDEEEDVQPRPRLHRAVELKLLEQTDCMLKMSLKFVFLFVLFFFFLACFNELCNTRQHSLFNYSS
jgi:hypothetical protein